jgi:hypothetical protein
MFPALYSLKARLTTLSTRTGLFFLFAARDLDGLMIPQLKILAKKKYHSEPSPEKQRGKCAVERNDSSRPGGTTSKTWLGFTFLKERIIPKIEKMTIQSTSSSLK